MSNPPITAGLFALLGLDSYYHQVKAAPPIHGDSMNSSRSRCLRNEKPDDAVIKEMTEWREDAAGAGKAEST